MLHSRPLLVCAHLHTGAGEASTLPESWSRAGSGVRKGAGLYLVVALVVRDPLGVLLVEVEAVLH